MDGPLKERGNQRYTAAGYREVAVAMVLVPHHGSWALVFVTSRNHPKTLTLPKGGWESFETVEEAAQREAMEEGGIKCSFDHNRFHSWGHETSFNGKPKKKSVLHTIPLVLDRLEASWLEQHERKRFVIPVANILDHSEGVVTFNSESWAVKPEFIAIVQRHFSDKRFVDILEGI